MLIMKYGIDILVVFNF